jgi:hypothetical protein
VDDGEKRESSRRGRGGYLKWLSPRRVNALARSAKTLGASFFRHLVSLLPAGWPAQVLSRDLESAARNWISQQQVFTLLESVQILDCSLGIADSIY